MRRDRDNENSIGWVSMTDTLMFAFGLMLVFALVLSRSLEQEKAQAGTITAQNNVLNEENKKLLQTQTETDSLKKSVEEKSASEADLRSRLGRAKTIYFQQKDKIASLTLKASNATKSEKLLAEERKRFEVLQASYEELSRSVEANQASERQVRSELLGLQSNLGRVAIVFDASESMKTGDRWESAKKVMLDWVEHLDMQECKLIVFNDFVKAYPRDEQLLSLRGDQGEKARNLLQLFLGRIKPIGRTNTLDAMKEAYKIKDLDAIVLFTDGAPYVGGENNRYDAEMIEAIYELCREHADIPVNAVGLGDYFVPELSEFLLTISELTGGTFIGK